MGITASVIIPTYNRKSYLLDLLEAIAQQTWPTKCYEVIVVDDGSTDGTGEIEKKKFPFTLRYIQQANQGDASARNLGAMQSQSDVLVLLDDDMIIRPDYLTYILEEHQNGTNRVVVGTEHLWVRDDSPLAEPDPLVNDSEPEQLTAKHSFPFAFSRNMSLRREAYLSLGMMDDLGFSGSSIWCDVDFAYRAYLQGYQFLRSTRAICYHRDYVARSLGSAKKRNWEAAYRAVVMFHRYPDLLPYIPMFHDKTPINWRQDPPLLQVRKLLRPIASSGPTLSVLEKITRYLERQNSASNLLSALRRWIIGGYIFHGYRAGLRDFGPIPEMQRSGNNYPKGK